MYILPYVHMCYAPKSLCWLIYPSAQLKIIFSYFSTKTYVVGTQENCVNETVSFEHPKQMFKQMDYKTFIIWAPTVWFS